MSSSSLTEKTDNKVTSTPVGQASVSPELAPSVMLQDALDFPRAIGAIAAGMVLFGGIALLLNLFGPARMIDAGSSLVILALGMGGLLFHAAFDHEIQFRRLYMVVALLLLAVGLLLSFVPYPKTMGQQLPWAIPVLLLSMLFFLCFTRHEMDSSLRQPIELVFGLAGALFALVGFGVSLLYEPFFLPMGFVLSLMGLVYGVAFIATRSNSDDIAYYGSLALAAFGLLVALLVLGRSLFTATGGTFFVGSGFVMLLVTAVYIGTGLVMGLDWTFFVLVRRELSSFFLSPMAYLALFTFAVLAWLSFVFFASTIYGNIAPEPVLRFYVISYLPVFGQLFIVPVLTMRLLSEEKRTGTLEVMLTAPVDEPTVVLAKFFAGLLTYLLVWIPFGLILLTIPAVGAPMFDYRPMLSFSLALLMTGSMFISMGLFCSSLSDSQIGAGVLSFIGMVLLTLVFFFTDESVVGTTLAPIMKHISFMDTWRTAMAGRVVLREYLFSMSMTVLFLFMTVKVLESRKWS
ncbi:MAG: ABC transporter permease [Gemmataceae bacterium]